MQHLFFHMNSMTIEKSHNVDGQPKNFKIKGLASTNSKDGDGEILDPKGFDLSRFKYINYNHGKNPNDVIGEITKAEVTKNGLEVEGILYGNNETAKQVYDLSQNMDSAGNGMMLGLSVEGRTVEASKNKIKKAELFGMAVCLVPVNGDTFVNIHKSIFGKENQNQNEKTMDLKELSPLDLSKAYEEASKKMGVKKNLEKNEETEEGDMDEEDDEELDAEIKKSILDLHAKGRENAKIALVVSDYFEKSISVAKIEKTIAQAQSPEGQAMDIVKSYMDSQFAEVKKGLGTMIDSVMQKVDALQTDLDKMGLQSKKSKTQEVFEKGVQASPYDGGGKHLYLSNPQHREIIKSMVVEVFGGGSSQSVDIEASATLKPHDKARLEDAKGVKIV